VLPGPANDAGPGGRDTDMSTAAAQLSGDIELVVEDGVRVLRLRGEVDSLTVDAWQAFPDGPPVEAVDASAATFMDARGLRMMVRATEPARRSGHVPELRAPSRTVRRILELAGATPLFATVG